MYAGWGNKKKMILNYKFKIFEKNNRRRIGIGIYLDFAMVILRFVLDVLSSWLYHSVQVQIAGSAKTAACTVEPGELPKMLRQFTDKLKQVCI